MPKIKHIAIATQDAAKTAAFYKDVFGLREIAQLESANANGYLTQSSTPMLSTM